MTGPKKQYMLLVKGSFRCQGDPGSQLCPQGINSSGLIILQISLNFTFLTSKSEYTIYLMSVVRQ